MSCSFQVIPSSSTMRDVVGAAFYSRLISRRQIKLDRTFLAFLLLGSSPLVRRRGRRSSRSRRVKRSETSSTPM